jgi:hypothetical protein
MVIFSDGRVGSTQETAHDFSAWSWTVGAPTVVNTRAHHGSYGFYFNAEERCAKSAAAAILFARAYFYFDTLPGGGTLALFWLDSTGGWGWDAGVLITNNIFTMFTQENGVEVTTSTGITAVADTWYCVELKKDVTNDLLELWINGISRASEARSITKNTATFNLGVYFKWGTPTIDFYADCVVLDSAYVGVETTVRKGGNSALMSALLAGKLFG